MKPYLSLLVFIALAGSSIFAGTGSYMSTRDEIRRDLSSALNRTLAERGGAIITTDTINTCRRLQGNATAPVSLLVSDDYFNRCLSIPQLKGQSYIALSVISGMEEADSNLRNVAEISGDTIIIRPFANESRNLRVAFRGCSECSFMTVLGLSDQRLSITLSLMAMLWAAFSLVEIKHRKTMLQPVGLVSNTQTSTCDVQRFGNMSFDTATNDFHDTAGNVISFTPMQHQLMQMFINSPSGKLSKQDICDELWPRKPDASDTLYTLIRRLKPVVERSTDLTIDSERGRAYVLKCKEN